ncbi:MAG: PAS domain S-box protein [Sphingomonas sp.]|uniref:GAF domain-containing hybrid sensor histidine kinase/response regulator n=1 Tax=Sphingomonas sp. TaxID=28214 RepID=UPI001B08794C|nr:PAS domain S-box protein [Sphingomonas sp.]MBO9624570.1 PAS domain S-box protein [Sphingomonas sp.]
MDVNSGEDLTDIFPGSSEMAGVMRRHDWSSSPLGDPRQWSDALKIPMRMLLTSRFEMWLGWGPDLCFFYNDAYIPTLGLKHPAMFGRPFREVWSEIYDELTDQVESVWAGEATWNKALRLLLERNGYPEETYHSFSYSPLHEADGSVGGLLCIVTEETEKVITERRLETLRHLGAALVGAADTSMILDAARSVFAANRRDFPFAALRLLDDEHPDDTAYATDPSLIPAIDAISGFDADPAGTLLTLPEDHPWPTGDWDRAPRQAIAIAVPGPVGEAPLGTLVLGLNPYRPDDPDVLNIARLISAQFSGALANVTERRLAEQALSESEKQFRHLVQGVTDYAIYMIDLEGHVSSWNEGARRIKGYEPEEIIGEHFSRFYTEEDRARGEPAHALETARREGRFLAEGWRVRKDGERFRASVVIDAIRDDAGKPIGFAKITRDVTEREATQLELEQAREALFQSQKMEAIGQLTGGIAHDFNNLLMAVLSSLDLLRKRIPEDPLTQRFLDNAIQGAQRGATLTQRMLAFARRQDLKMGKVDLSQLLSGMGDLVQRSIGTEWPISTNLPIGLPRVKADANQLEMALLNLIVNARDATPSGGPIVVSATREDVADGHPRLNAGSYVRLVVADKGSGMDEETLRRATEPFFTTKGVGKGTGLGLPMVHGMAHQSGGAFELLSAVGEGTRAVLWLPVAETEKAGAEPEAPEEMAPKISRLTVLVVDDDPLILMNVAALLEDLGHKVVEADSGAEAIDKFLTDNSIDVVITDQAMPGMTGAELIEAIRGTGSDVPIIVASGYGEGMEGLGGDVIRLGKPFNQVHLARAIAEASEKLPVKAAIP